MFINNGVNRYRIDTEENFLTFIHPVLLYIHATYENIVIQTVILAFTVYVFMYK